MSRTGGFHVFSVEWTPNEYIFRISGHEVWRTSQGVSDHPGFLILSLLSSDFELPAVGADPIPRIAEIDWVAFWQEASAADRAARVRVLVTRRSTNEPGYGAKGVLGDALAGARVPT